MQTTDRRQLYTMKEVASLLRVSVRAVKRMIERQELIPCSFGYRTIRIPAHQIDRLIKERTLGLINKGTLTTKS